MKITKIEVFRLPTSNSKQNSPIGCRIHTDAGIRGDGEAGMAYGVGGSAALFILCRSPAPGSQFFGHCHTASSRVYQVCSAWWIMAQVICCASSSAQVR